MQITESLFNLTDYKLSLRVPNRALDFLLLELLANALVCRPFLDSFSLFRLVASHLCVVSTAALLMNSYVGRRVAQHGLKMEVC